MSSAKADFKNLCDTILMLSVLSLSLPGETISQRLEQGLLRLGFPDVLHVRLKNSRQQLHYL